VLRYFGISTFLTLAAIVAAGIFIGPAAAWTTIVLIAIEVAFSFDNAIVNAKVLDRLSPFWQKLFLTVGMLFAIVIVRFALPILIVMITAGLSWSQVVNEALHQPAAYSAHLAEAHTSISAFGGSFLLLLTLYFLLDDGRQVLWLQRIERPLQKIGGTLWLPPLLVLLLVSILSIFAEDGAEVFRAGALGVVLYTALHLLIEGLGKLSPKGDKMYVGWAAFLAFMYLQLLDASFSFDGVLGAFAITDKVLLIALGLGVGALWVRSLTVFMVRRGTLANYKYLEHGAHYAILVLALALLGSVFYEVPDALTGVVGLGVIFASFIASRQAIRARHQAG
jgi:hypothetical protein